MTTRKGHLMRITGALIAIACAASFFGCAATVPSELTSARLAYAHASEGPAAQMAPADLHTAEKALAQAEASFSKDAKSYRTRDLAYVAQRKAEIAEAQASIAIEQARTAQADKAYQATQGNLLQEKTEDLNRTQTALAASEQNRQETATQLAAEKRARAVADDKAAAERMRTQGVAQDLNQTRTALALSEQSGQATQAQLEAEQSARAQAEKQAADAQAALAKLAAVREEARGMIITLSGTVLFRSGEARLMPGAESKLDQVVAALVSIPDRNIVVEGYTDSQGSDQYNQELSQRRADAVRNYFIHKGYPSGRVQANGMGEEHPIASNATSEGRANNRRVEIVLENPVKQ